MAAAAAVVAVVEVALVEVAAAAAEVEVEAGTVGGCPQATTAGADSSTAAVVLEAATAVALATVVLPSPKVNC